MAYKYKGKLFLYRQPEKMNINEEFEILPVGAGSYHQNEVYSHLGPKEADFIFEKIKGLKIITIVKKSNSRIDNLIIKTIKKNKYTNLDIEYNAWFDTDYGGEGYYKNVGFTESHIVQVKHLQGLTVLVIKGELVRTSLLGKSRVKF